MRSLVHCQGLEHGAPTGERRKRSGRKGRKGPTTRFGKEYDWACVQEELAGWMRTEEMETLAEGHTPVGMASAAWDRSGQGKELVVPSAFDGKADEEETHRRDSYRQRRVSGVRGAAIRITSTRTIIPLPF